MRAEVAHVGCHAPAHERLVRVDEQPVAEAAAPDAARAQRRAAGEHLAPPQVGELFALARRGAGRGAVAVVPCCGVVAAAAGVAGGQHEVGERHVQRVGGGRAERGERAACEELDVVGVRADGEHALVAPRAQVQRARRGAEAWRKRRAGAQARGPRRRRCIVVVLLAAQRRSSVRAGQVNHRCSENREQDEHARHFGIQGRVSQQIEKANKIAKIRPSRKKAASKGRWPLEAVVCLMMPRSSSRT